MTLGKTLSSLFQLSLLCMLNCPSDSVASCPVSEECHYLCLHGGCMIDHYIDLYYFKKILEAEK